MVEVGDIAVEASTVEEVGDMATAEGAGTLATPRLRPCPWLRNFSAAAAVEDKATSATLRQELHPQPAAAVEDKSFDPLLLLLHP